MDFRRLLQLLHDHDVAFLIVGGVAATIHGSSRLTQDLDVVYDRDNENLQRLVYALDGQRPYLRGAPPGLPFEWSVATLRAGLNFTLQTDLGPIDLFGDIAGGGTYQDLVNRTIDVAIFGMQVRCLDLDTLIQTKRAAGRPRDLEAIAELEIIRESQGE